MKRPVLLLMSMIGLIAAGLIISAIANQDVFDDLAIGDGEVMQGVPFEVSTVISADRGVFFVEMMNHDSTMQVNVQVIGPFGRTLTSATITDAQYQEGFDVDEEYEYVLRIESDSREPISVLGVLGPEPDATQTTINMISLYLLLAGLIGTVMSAVYLIIERRRSSRGRYSTGYR